MGWQELNQVCGHGNGAHARSASPMGDGKCLMQVQVASTGSQHGRIGQANLVVHIRPVHIYLSAVFMNDTSHFEDIFFKDPVCGGISDHKGSKVITVLYSQVPELIQPDITPVITA